MLCQENKDLRDCSTGYSRSVNISCKSRKRPTSVGTRLVLAMLLFGQTAFPATLLKRELFDEGSSTNVGRLTTAEPGQFDFVSNEIPRVAFGSASNGMGWSGLLAKGENRGRWMLDGTPAATNGYFCGWFYWHLFASSAIDGEIASQPSEFLGLSSKWHGQGFALRTYGNGQLEARYYSGVTTNLAVLERNHWYFIGVAWSFFSSTSVLANITVFLGTNANPPTLLCSNTARFHSYGGFVEVGTTTNEGSWNPAYSWAGRMSGLSLYVQTNLAEGFYPAELSVPPSSRHWHVNPAIGNDVYDGTTPATAWASSGKLRDMLRFGGVMGNPVPWVYAATGAAIETNIDAQVFNHGVMDGAIRANGDIVWVDTSLKEIQQTNMMEIGMGANGVTIRGTNGPARFDPLVTITGSWTAYDNLQYPNVWMTTNTEPWAVLWEDDKWLNAPTGSTVTAVASNLNATPGSFYNNDGMLYLHPFGSTGPNKDGKTYQRSRYLSNKSGSVSRYSAWNLEGSSLMIHGIQCGGVSFLNPTNASYDAVYVMRNGNWNGRTVIGGCDLFRGANHVYANSQTDHSNYFTLNFSNTYRQDPPWMPGMAATVVLHTRAHTAGGRWEYFYDCDWSKSAQVGTAADVEDNGLFLMHDDLVGNFRQFDAVYFTNCVGRINIGAGMIEAEGLELVGGVHKIIKAGANFPAIRRCKIADYVTGDAGGEVENSIISFAESDVSTARMLQGDWRFLSCTLDGRNIPNVTPLFYQSLYTVTSATLSLSNSIVLLPQDATETTAFRVATNGSHRIDRNLFQPDGSGYVARDEMGLLDWSEWQSRGWDVNSVAVADPRVDAAWNPQADSPARGLGAGGWGCDFTGRCYDSRMTAGAIEYHAFPWIEAQPRGQVQYLGKQIIFSVLADGTAPLFYQWRMNDGSIAGATNSTFAIPAGDATLAGYYSVVISNVDGCVTSSPAALLLVNLEVQSSDPDACATLSFFGPIGFPLEVSFIDDLVDPENWQVWTNLMLPSNPYHLEDCESSGVRSRFYRSVPLLGTQ